MSSSEFTSRFGEPEAAYRPSPGQTLAGVLVTAGFAAAFFGAAVFGYGLDLTNRVCAALLGLASVVMAVWLYRQRRWQLVIYSGGLVQVRPGGVDQLHWAEVREVIQTRLKGFGDATTRVTVVGPAGRVVVNPVNSRLRVRLFETLLAAAQRRGIPIRVEWQEVD